jgi:hypothetical protein
MATCTFIGDGDGISWHDPDNWDTFPGSTDDVVIPLGYDVVLYDLVTVNSITVAGTFSCGSAENFTLTAGGVVTGVFNHESGYGHIEGDPVVVQSGGVVNIQSSQYAAAQITAESGGVINYYSNVGDGFYFDVRSGGVLNWYAYPEFADNYTSVAFQSGAKLNIKANATFYVQGGLTIPSGAEMIIEASGGNGCLVQLSTGATCLCSGNPRSAYFDSYDSPPTIGTVTGGGTFTWSNIGLVNYLTMTTNTRWPTGINGSNILGMI